QRYVERCLIHTWNYQSSDSTSGSSGVTRTNGVSRRRCNGKHRTGAVGSVEARVGRRRKPTLVQWVQRSGLGQNVAGQPLERSAYIYTPPGQRIRPGQLELGSPGNSVLGSVAEQEEGRIGRGGAATVRYRPVGGRPSKQRYSAAQP